MTRTVRTPLTGSVSRSHSVPAGPSSARNWPPAGLTSRAAVSMSGLGVVAAPPVCPRPDRTPIASSTCAPAPTALTLTCRVVRLSSAAVRRQRRAWRNAAWLIATEWRLSGSETRKRASRAAPSRRAVASALSRVAARSAVWSGEAAERLANSASRLSVAAVARAALVVAAVPDPGAGSAGGRSCAARWRRERIAATASMPARWSRSA